MMTMNDGKHGEHALRHAELSEEDRRGAAWAAEMSQQLRQLEDEFGELERICHASSKT